MPTIVMSVSDWSLVKDNPRQRNTERRAKQAIANHLSSYEPVHRFVFAAVMDDDVVCKLDGHTRSYLWDKGLLDTPPDGNVEVNLIEVLSMKHASEVHDQLDSPKAAKRPCDVIYGACRENKFLLVSALLMGCEFSNQLRLADGFSRGIRNTSRDELNGSVKKWKSTLRDLDGLNLCKNYTTLIGFMLLVIKKDGVNVAGEFLKVIGQDQGTKTREGRDGVEALDNMMNMMKSSGKTAGYENLYEMADRAWTCYEAWKDGRRLKSVKMTRIATLFEKTKPRKKVKV